MKFSIIIITYNRGHLIDQTIDSVLKQTYQNFELIIVDDGSTDNTDNIIYNYLEKNNSRIKYIKKDKIGMLSKLRNIGFQYADGDIISSLDSDDLWHEEKLHEMYLLFSKHKEINFAIHNFSIFKNNENPEKPYYKFKYNFHKNILEEILMGKILAMPMFSMRKSITDELGLFDENIVDGQYDYYLNVCARYKVFYLNKTLAFYRKHDSNDSKKNNEVHFLHALRSIEELYNTNKINKKLYHKALNFMNYKTAKYYIRNNEKEKGKIYLNAIFNQVPITSRLYIRSLFLKINSLN